MKKGIIAIAIIAIMIIGTISFILLSGKNKENAEGDSMDRTIEESKDAGVKIDKPLDTGKDTDEAPLSTYDESLIGETIDQVVDISDEEWAAIPEDEKYEDPKMDSTGTWDPSLGIPPTKQQALDMVIKEVEEAAIGVGVFDFVPEVSGNPEMNDKGGFTCTVKNENGTTVFSMSTDSEGKVKTKLQGSIYNESFPGVIYNTEGDTYEEYAERIEKVLKDNSFYKYVFKIESADERDAYLRDMDDEKYHIVFDGNGSGKLTYVTKDGDEIDPIDAF